MTRGRKPKEAIRSAIRIAEKRGEVDLVRFRPGMIATLIIYCVGFVVHVRIKRMRHIRCSEQALELEASEDLAALRLIAESLQISRELWICSPRGNFRFFRVLADSLVELDRDGQPLPVQWPVRKRRFPAVTTPLGNAYVIVADAKPEAEPAGKSDEIPADPGPGKIPAEQSGNFPADAEPGTVPAGEAEDLADPRLGPGHPRGDISS
ncbi:MULTISPECIES: hypothetical protein [unclassified Methanoregula]|uniref:hypothetical protein n=1 Tax=unclassified Methanoregula TaxID=2649730 RepID=UPI0009C45664|nr:MULTISPECIES: hypothetical protein [unclassified Methanoregula]OPX63221.1 MAG: hypothetical protein A4E33_01904 [Methanoregula sp. PtaB.Bin085]OPY33521.1 MAG: hypothetical protein A4E34_01844 [Methanoregula sp. PtaU1.Bin006]